MRKYSVHLLRSSRKAGPSVQQVECAPVVADPEESHKTPQKKVMLFVNPRQVHERSPPDVNR
jgi:hypothetical protein